MVWVSGWKKEKNALPTHRNKTKRRKSLHWMGADGYHPVSEILLLCVFKENQENSLKEKSGTENRAPLVPTRRPVAPLRPPHGWTSCCIRGLKSGFKIGREITACTRTPYGIISRFGQKAIVCHCLVLVSPPQEAGRGWTSIKNPPIQCLISR